MATSIVKRTIHGRGLALTFFSMKGNAGRRLGRMIPQYQSVGTFAFYFYVPLMKIIQQKMFFLLWKLSLLEFTKYLQAVALHF